MLQITDSNKTILNYSSDSLTVSLKTIVNRRKINLDNQSNQSLIIWQN